MDDPERSQYEPLPPEIEAAMFDACRGTLRRAAKERGVDLSGGGRMSQIAASSDLSDSGHRWLVLLADDGTSWYVEWDGDLASATELASQFGEELASDIAAWG